MSQKNVERLIGRLATSEALRREFFADPRAQMQALVASGLELTAFEQRALLALDPEALDRFAETIAPCLQHGDMCGGHH